MRFSADMIAGSGLRDGDANISTVAPYSQLNVGIAREFLLPFDAKPVTVRFDVINLFELDLPDQGRQRHRRIRAAIRPAPRLLRWYIQKILTRTEADHRCRRLTFKMDRRGNNEHDRKRVADETARRYYSALAADIRRGQAWGREHTVGCGAKRAVGRSRLGAAKSAACTGSSGRSASAGLPGIPVPRITVSERFALAASAGRPA